MEFHQQLEADQKQIEAYLRAYFGDREDMANLYDAMNYSLLSGGKRVRPVLALEVCRMCGGDPETALPFACAVETTCPVWTTTTSAGAGPPIIKSMVRPWPSWQETRC